MSHDLPPNIGGQQSSHGRGTPGSRQPAPDRSGASRQAAQHGGAPQGAGQPIQHTPPGQRHPTDTPPAENPAGAQAGHGLRTAEPEQPDPRPDVSTPALRWCRLDHPDASVPIGEDDYVLESVFDHQRGAWEVLVLLQPIEEAED